ncbi:SDR family NAD(P)-dependent oxidoreductase [Microbacterium sp. No. 7]|uniref:SDR family NAD(P)-dependent oxidoreductase n=1 Tax=Microbacterium sp. No. 7 TaxID=1714373 RepID=UPI0006D05459|nr:3-oxoacyl-ACP reductase family protein [Microbacterium sp. No. 7]ALJ21913.1 2-hydroxycyclohexanecarboxyl-CoA dehydrogenase [Microbacterium sp. No. 7]
MAPRLGGKVAIVTGAARGIGLAIARRLHDDGARVAIADLDLDAAQRAARELGEPARGYEADVTSQEAVDRLVADVVADLGGVDVLVNNAGWDRVTPFLDSDPADWDRIVAINLYGVFHTTRAVLPRFIDQGGGAIVNIASDAGRVGSSGEAVYSATKGGIIAFTKTIAREHARHGIRVNSVCPGPTDTALFASIGGDGLRDALARAVPMKRIGVPEDIAGGVAYLASDDAGYVTGQTLSISGGLTMS